MTHDWIEPVWPAPANVRALSTTRSGGVSRGQWSQLNLGGHCGDHPDHVARNRRRLERLLPAAPLWLRQVHGATVVRHTGPVESALEPEADAVVAFAPARVGAVLTADCLAVLLCNRAGDRVGAAHAGWRGLAAGVLRAIVAALGGSPKELIAWMGPAIGPAAYEVGAEVLEAFSNDAFSDYSGCFKPSGGRWLFDLYAAARLQLAAAGVTDVYGGGLCTFSDPDRFYSYRRDGQTGRMATLIWFE